MRRQEFGFEYKVATTVTNLIHSVITLSEGALEHVPHVVTGKVQMDDHRPYYAHAGNMRSVTKLKWAPVIMCRSHSRVSPEPMLNYKYYSVNVVFVQLAAHGVEKSVKNLFRNMQCWSFTDC